jgi:hypothetical protein
MPDPRFLPADPARHLEGSSTGSQVEHLLGGSEALPRMLQDIRTASGPNSFVYMASWNCEIDLVVTGPAGPDTLKQALSVAANAGAQLRLLLWAGGVDQATLRALAFGFTPLDVQALMTLTLLRSPAAAHNLAACVFCDLLAVSGKDAAREYDSRTLVAGAHHQKILVVGTAEDVIAYVGGIEFSTDRLNAKGRSGEDLKGAPLFDISLRVRGPAAWAILRTFTERWQATVARRLPALRGLSRLASPPPSLPGGLETQVTHTYGIRCPYTVKVQTAAEAITATIRSTKNFLYMEDQYYVGTYDLAQEIAKVLAADSNRWAVVVIAAEDSVVDLSDVGYRRRQMLRPLVSLFPGRFFVFERIGDDGSTVGRTAYVHSKLTIVDDVAAVIGSANSNYRSWTHDSEVMLTLVDPAGPGGPEPKDWRPIRSLRASIWQRHLFRVAGSAPSLGDPAAARPLWEAVWKSSPVAPPHIRRYEVFGSVPRKLPGSVDSVWTKVLDARG